MDFKCHEMKETAIPKAIRVDSIELVEKSLVKIDWEINNTKTKEAYFMDEEEVKMEQGHSTEGRQACRLM